MAVGARAALGFLDATERGRPILTGGSIPACRRRPDVVVKRLADHLAILRRDLVEQRGLQGAGQVVAAGQCSGQSLQLAPQGIQTHTQFSFRAMRMKKGHARRIAVAEMTLTNVNVWVE